MPCKTEACNFLNWQHHVLFLLPSSCKAGYFSLCAPVPWLFFFCFVLFGLVCFFFCLTLGWKSLVDTSSSGQYPLSLNRIAPTPGLALCLLSSFYLLAHGYSCGSVVPQHILQQNLCSCGQVSALSTRVSLDHGLNAVAQPGCVSLFPSLC